MPAVEELAACVGFWPPYLKVGSDLLIYASATNGEYYTGICGGHKLVTNHDDRAYRDFSVLGLGLPPKKREDSK
jgi:hypothetical protein